jgi:hypothetical protein
MNSGASTKKLTAENYRRWMTTGEAGQRELNETLDEAVSDLVDKREVVEPELVEGLRDWLDLAVRQYFTVRWADLTDKQYTDTIAGIEETSAKLWEQLDRVAEVQIAHHLAAMKHAHRGVMSYLRNRQSTRTETKGRRARVAKLVQRAPQTSNASKARLHALTERIREFWVTGWTTLLEDPRPTDIRAQSNYVRFASCVYALVGERSVSTRTILNRLKAAEPQHPWHDGHLHLHVAICNAERARERLVPPSIFDGEEHPTRREYPMISFWGALAEARTTAERRLLQPSHLKTIGKNKRF